MESTAPHLTHALPMLMPFHANVGRGQAALTRAAFAAGDALRLGARTARETLPRPRHVSTTEALSARALPQGRRPARRAARLGRAARGRRPPGRDHRAHGRVVRRPHPHPGPGAGRGRYGRAAARRADRRRDRRRGPDGRERRRGVGRRPGRRTSAAEPGQPPRAPRRVAAGPAGLRDGAGAGQHQPLRDGAAAARRHGVRRPHRRAGRRPGPRRAGAVRRPRSTSCSTSSRRRWPGR